MRDATSRIASSRRRRLASANAMSSALGPSPGSASGSNSRDLEVCEPRRHHEIVRRECLERRNCRAASIKDRYWSASAKIEIFCQIDLLLNAQASAIDRGGLQNPSTSTIMAGSVVPRSAPSVVSNSSPLMRQSFVAVPFDRHLSFAQIPCARLACRTPRTPLAGSAPHQPGERTRQQAQGPGQRRPPSRLDFRCSGGLGHILRSERLDFARPQCRTVHSSKCRRSSTRPLNPTKAANHLPHHCDRSGGGRDWVYSAKHNMRSHPKRQARQRPERRKIDRL